MKKAVTILVLALIAQVGFGQILKKVDIEIKALEKTAKIAHVKFIAKDRSYLVYDLYEIASRTVTEVSDMDEANIKKQNQGKWEPVNLLAKNRTLKGKLKVKELISQKDYEYFYPVIVELTEAEKKAARISELEKKIEKLTVELENLKK